ALAHDESIDLSSFVSEPDVAPLTLPAMLNKTPYTGKGVKVGVIDTGIDYNHPDLEANYRGGYDLVDLDDDPMETDATQGMPTIPGTHVSGIIAAQGEMNGIAADADNHPDLVANYGGGYDLVDLDDDPVETDATQGMPTIHGTHVSGIIAANGEMKGIAPDADIYAYRALGPGGSGSSVQVIAALERAV